MTVTTTVTNGVQPSVDQMVCYNFYCTPSMLNVTFHKGDKSTPVVYYGQSKSILTTPAFYVRRESDSGPVLSFSRVPCMSKSISIGLGDGSDGKSQEMTRDRFQWYDSDYHFDHDNAVYDWRKDKKKSSATAYDCLNDDGKVCATLLSGGAMNLRKGGELHIRDDLDEDLKHLLIAGALSIWTIEALNLKSIVQAF